MISGLQLWQATRDLLIALLGLYLAIATLASETMTLYSWGAWAAVFLFGLISLLLARFFLPLRPVAGLRALEWRVRLFHTSVAVLPFALVVLGLGLLSGNVTGASEKYWLGTASGFALAALSAAFLNPGKNLDWTASFVETTFQKDFKKCFEGSSAEMPDGLKERFPRHGLAHRALWDHRYTNEKDEPVRGWGRKDRRARAETLKFCISQHAAAK
jgi:hypothetical protein